MSFQIKGFNPAVLTTVAMTTTLERDEEEKLEYLLDFRVHGPGGNQAVQLNYEGLSKLTDHLLDRLMVMRDAVEGKAEWP